MRKNSIQIYDELQITKLIETCDDKDQIENAILNIQSRNPLDLKSLQIIEELSIKYPTLEKYFIQELTRVENIILHDLGANRDSFDRELIRLEKI